MLLAVECLSIGYRSNGHAHVPAVEEVSLTLEAGATLGIVGESGSGKSTLARALLGYLRPGSAVSGGRVLLDRQDLFALPRSRLRDVRGGTVALVPQQPLAALTPHLRVGDQVAEVVRAHADVGRADATLMVRSLFARTLLPEPDAIARRYPHQLSGGQRQRVAIAAALAGNPRLLVLDEPTTALDKTTEAEVLALVQDLQARTGAALVYVSHDLRVVRAMCAQVVVMRGGRAIEAGATQAVFRAPRTRYAADLVAAMPDLSPPPAVPAVRGAGRPLLQVERLGFRYPVPGMLGVSRHAGPPVLHGLSFGLARGGSLGLVGESGSGKTTVAALIAGLLHGADGTILFDGKPLHGRARNRTPELRRRIQLVFQDPLSSLNPSHSVEALVGRPLRLFFGCTAAEARRRTARLLESFALDASLLSRHPAELSGGQQQRVALARAFAAEPDLLICDEVTSALDVTIQAQVVDLLRALRRTRDVAFLFISHDLGFMASVADELVVLRRGEVCEQGATAAILASPGHGYTRLLLDAYAGATPLRIQTV